MDIVYGIAGVISLGLFAAFMGFDVRDLFRSGSGVSWMDEDPNSTIGVTRDLLAEKGEPMLISQARAS